MTETSNELLQSQSRSGRRKEAKQFARNCFLKKGNTLLLIGATLIPIMLFVMGQGIYTMLYAAQGDTVTISEDLLQVVNILFILLSAPLIGGLMYIVTGLAHGEERHIKDVFYPYTSLRAFFRTVMALVLPSAAVFAVIALTATAVNVTHGMYELSSLMEEGAALYYGDIFWYSGIFIAFVVCLIGLVLAGYLFPFLWLVFSETDQPLTQLLSRSVYMAHRHLLSWLWLQCSFLGWLLLSVATVGILLVLFVIPYYLLTVTRYLDLFRGAEQFTNE